MTIFRDKVLIEVMKKYKSLILLSFLTILLLSIVFWRFQLAYSRILTYEMPIEDVLSDLADRREAILNPDDDIQFADNETINLLLLGLDSRKGQSDPNCDAIHMVQFNTNDWSIDITSVPRGTYALIPGSLPEHEYYLANTCSYVGLEYGIEQIERVVGVRADYYATVGFSDVYGILRVLQLPTSQSLQWLRHRQGYAIGDPQRSRNQAVFMKDIILTQLNRFRSDSFRPMLFVMYGMLDTDMDFATARALLAGYLNTRIDERPDDIRLRMRPYYEVEDYHLDFDNPDEQIENLLRRVAPFLSESDLSRKPLSQYQKELVEFLEEEIDDDEGVWGVIDKRLWLQIEDDEEREYWHWRFMERRVDILLAEGELDKVERLLTEYIVEKEALEEWQYFEQGKDLLRSVIQ